MSSIDPAIPVASVRPLPVWSPLAGLLLLATMLLPCGDALAAGTANVPVNATLLSKSNCKFRGSTTAALAFGNVDPASNTPASASASLTIRCAGAAPIASFALSQDSGLHGATPTSKRMKHATLNEFLPYTLTLSPTSGTVVKNVDLVVSIAGTIAPADFQDASAGTYSDTVIVTLNP